MILSVARRERPFLLEIGPDESAQAKSAMCGRLHLRGHDNLEGIVVAFAETSESLTQTPRAGEEV
jgi:hypothetical protein